MYILSPLPPSQMKNRINTLSFLLAGSFLACADGPTAPATADEAVLASTVTFDARPAAGVQQQVTGHADIGFEFPVGTMVVDQYSFSAVRHRDNRVTGQLEFRAKYLGLRVRVHGELLCFNIIGNRARLAAVITKTTFEDSPPPGQGGLPIGEKLTWSVTDGRGNDDLASPLLGEPTKPVQDPSGFCENALPYPWEMPLRRGAIQIHQ